MFARFDENPAMTLRVIKETKRYGRKDGRTDGQTDGRTDGQRENSIPPTNKVCGGYNYPACKELIPDTSKATPQVSVLVIMFAFGTRHVPQLNPFPAIHNFCCLLSHLLM